MKTCVNCKQPKELSDFSIRVDRNTQRPRCKVCMRLYWAERRIIEGSVCLERTRKWNKLNRGKKNALTKKRSAAKLLRTPSWLSESHYKNIEQFYTDATYLTYYTKTKFEVDHIIPLQGELISGLHVPWNLQLLTESENCKKNNRL